LKLFFTIMSICHWGLGWSLLVLIFDVESVVSVTLINILLSFISLTAFYGMIFGEVKYKVESNSNRHFTPQGHGRQTVNNE